jgi:PEP-CTERM motif-containing protein
MPAYQVHKVSKAIGLLLATAVWLVTAAPVSAAFWFPLPFQPQPGDIPLPPIQVAPNNNPSNPIDNPGDAPPPDVSPSVSGTPEPASIILSLVGIGSLGAAEFWRRRKRRNSSGG